MDDQNMVNEQPARICRLKPIQARASLPSYNCRRRKRRLRRDRTGRSDIARTG